MDDELKKSLLEVYGNRAKLHLSIQDIARLKNVTVDQVLEAIGESSMSTVTLGGDLIDASDAGPGATMNYGQTVKVPFSTN